MNRTLKIIIPLFVLVVALPIGGYAYWLVGRPTAAPSNPAQPDANTPLAPAPMPEATAPSAVPVEPGEGETVFRISSEESLATFTLDEILRGEPKTVVGTTKNVSGEIALDRANLDQTHLGTMRINARTFTTDSEQRNRAIVRLIFKSEDPANEFIEFTPTETTGIPAVVENGVPFTFTTVGDLKISGVTQRATFLGTATFESDDRLRGSAKTVVRYAEYGLSVPDLPFLADVD